MKKSKTELKTYFQSGDKPTQQNYEDLIDSFIDAQQPAGEANRSFVIDANGDVTVAVAPSSGGGLPTGFYEQGNYIPEVFKGTTEGEFGSSTANFVRVGNLVQFSISLSELISEDAGGDFNITLPFPSIDSGSVTVNSLIVGTSGEALLSPTDVIVEAVTIQNKIWLKDRYGRSMNVVFGTPGSQLIVSGSYQTNEYQG
ncbi:hypothetical protein T190611E02C_60067 [Tenacibaculum sp. 190524A05c]|uniref:hypothetical protein n=1 Tax=Tenacibaculum platacis TaxID=3137852 RepID=UPI0031FA4BB5